MKQTIYNFKPTKIKLKNDREGQVVQVRDYFEFYTTGIETVPFKNENHYFETTRFEAERSEILSFQMLESEDLSDVILALNNDVYLWDSPMTYDLKMEVLANKMEIIRYNFYKNDPKQIEDPYVSKYWQETFMDQMDKHNEIQQKVIIPKFPKVQRVVRDIKRYLDKRRVH